MRSGKKQSMRESEILLSNQHWMKDASGSNTVPTKMEITADTAPGFYGYFKCEKRLHRGESVSDKMSMKK